MRLRERAAREVSDSKRIVLAGKCAYIMLRSGNLPRQPAFGFSDGLIYVLPQRCSLFSCFELSVVTTRHQPVPFPRIRPARTNPDGG